MRYFEVININYKHAQTIIDGIRVIADPVIKHKAHVTIKGPFNNESDIRSERIKNENQIVKITGVGNFFNENQNTVYLSCVLKDRLKKMIYKPDYGGDNPHITIYNGDNRDYADRLFSIIKKYPISFQVIINELDIIHSKKEFETFGSEFYNHLSYYLNEDVSEEFIKNLNINQRLVLIEKLVSIFNNNDNENVIANPCKKILSNLNYSQNNGLFYYDDIESWNEYFPYRVIQAIHQIKPFAFFSLHDKTEVKRFDYNLPFVFIFSNPSQFEEDKIKRDVFNFGNAPIIIIDYRFQVKIFNGLFFNGNYKEPQLELIGNYDNLSEFSYERLVTKTFWDEHLNKKSGKKIYDSFLQNLTEIRHYLIFNSRLNPAICNRLIGRLLFIRYFIDRGVAFLKEDENTFFPSNIENARINFSEFIKDKNKLYDFFEYFKYKYNGDLFPVYQEEIDTVNPDHLNLLSELFRGGDFTISSREIYIQPSLFDVYDFSIIPIELVSNVYERFMGEKKGENKAFYTPYFLADFVLENTVGKYIRSIKNSEDFMCPVLDPSCGSGVFLVEALRKIIEKKIELKQRSLTNIELWNCVLENIYGIDIDADAIDVAIFSIYVTILDYVEPKEISSNFKFIKLKEKNFFPKADFFDTKHNYNLILNSISLRYIIGNPPWGQIKNSPYMLYCREREKEESNIIGISDNQIAQAFLIRVSDFFSSITECAFVITSKIFYNSKAKNWRKYFLNHFSISDIVDFSPVRTSLFQGAAWPASIVFYSHKPKETINLISVKTKEFFKRFNSFVIDKHSTKEFDYMTFLKLCTNYDWFWKVMLYGSYFDYLIIKRLKEQYISILKLIEETNLEYGVGLKRKDGNKCPDASVLIGYNFIDTGKKDLMQFLYRPTSKWNNQRAGNIPNRRDKNNFPILFKAPMALIKEGLTPDIKGVAAYCEEDIVFTHSIRAIKGSVNDIEKLKTIVGLINSNLFSYYILHTGTSAGIDLTRANQIEQLSFPVAISTEIAEEVDRIRNLDVSTLDYNNQRKELIKILNKKVLEIYNIKNLEQDFVDYALNYLIPSLGSNSINTRIQNSKRLQEYIKVYLDYFIATNISFNIASFVDMEFIGVVFSKNKNGEENCSLQITENENVIDKMRFYFSLTIEQISKKVFLQKSIVEIAKNNESYVILKSNECLNWHPAVAWLDLADFIKAIIKPKSEIIKIYDDLYNWNISNI